MMRLRLMLFPSLLLVLLVAGCSDSPTISPGVDYENIALVQRPEFVDTRPQAEIEASVLHASEEFVNSLAMKKPIKPDPGGDDPNPNPAHKYAFIVGISDYEGTANDLQYCDDDARAMKSYYQSQGFTCQSVIDRSATASNIIDGLNWLAAQAQPGDEIAFSYSGHGNKFGGDGSSIISTDLYYIPHAYVMEIINSANCTKVLVTLDACKIGNFLADGNDGSLIATASNNTYSYDAPDLQAGAWTYYFLEGADQHVFGEDIASYAEDGMKAWAKIYKIRVSPAHTDKYTGMLDI